MTYPNVCLRRGEAADVRAGQTLIFDNELDWADDTCTDGCIVDVLDDQLRFAARGFFNSRSKITVRVLTRDPSETITRDFFRSRIEAAWRARQQLGFYDSCRVVFGETDGLPGLTVDKFASCLSFQITCLGLESWKQDLIDILADLFHPLGIYERDDLPVREKEDFPSSKPASMAASRRSLKSASMTRACSSASRTGRKPVTSSTSRKTAGASAPIAPAEPFWIYAAARAASPSMPRSTARSTSPPSTSPSRRSRLSAATPL